jgi:hypothetical protein
MGWVWVGCGIRDSGFYVYLYGWRFSYSYSYSTFGLWTTSFPTIYSTSAFKFYVAYCIIHYSHPHPSTSTHPPETLRWGQCSIYLWNGNGNLDWIMNYELWTSTQPIQTSPFTHLHIPLENVSNNKIRFNFAALKSIEPNILQTHLLNIFRLNSIILIQ